MKAVIIWWNGRRDERIIPYGTSEIKIAVLKPQALAASFREHDPDSLAESITEEAIFWQSGWADSQSTVPIYTQKSGPDPEGRHGL